jgi:hypothetical protein
MNAPAFAGHSYFERFLVVRPLRFVLAMWRSWLRLMESYMLREAPLSELLLRRPRLAANAAPAAICCFFDFAGIVQYVRRFRH